MNSNNTKIIFLLCLVALCSCEKYLDVKSNKQLSTPDTIEDLQALLDNQYIYYNAVGATQTAADDYFIPSTTWETAPLIPQLAYIWDAKLDDEADWVNQYELILIANTVLDKVDKIDAGQKADEIKGAALFLRAHCYYQLAQLYAPQYDYLTAKTDLGIVLRQEADFSIPSQRASVQQTYDQIVADLEQSISLLPETSSSNTRPNKAAGYALLARTYLQVENYEKANAAADQSLNHYDILIDYNNSAEVNTSLSSPFLKLGILNKEILFFQADQLSFKIYPTARVDSSLYNLYDSNDIRKTAFFIQNPGETSYRFRGSYVAPRQFTGVSTPEVYLIKAESNARQGNTMMAIETLNKLLIKRYKTSKMPPLLPTTQEQALNIILNERKKEMLYRGMRWADLKRLNKNANTAITLKRIVGNKVYELPPNDLRYTLLIPSKTMLLSKIEQNKR